MALSRLFHGNLGEPRAREQGQVAFPSFAVIGRDADPCAPLRDYYLRIVIEL